MEKEVVTTNQINEKLVLDKHFIFEYKCDEKKVIGSKIELHFSRDDEVPYIEELRKLENEYGEYKIGSMIPMFIFPAVSSMQLFKSFKRVTIFACCFSVFCAISGILISIIAGTPVGSTIVIIDIAGFVICKLVSLALHRS